jgi:adenylosuccinate lyase
VLLALVEAGMSRDEAYRVVQGAAMRAWEGGESFRAQLEADEQVRERLGGRLEGLFDPGYHLRNLDAVFDRVVKLKKRLNHG